MKQCYTTQAWTAKYLYPTAHSPYQGEYYTEHSFYNLIENHVDAYILRKHLVEILHMFTGAV